MVPTAWLRYSRPWFVICDQGTEMNGENYGHPYGL